MSSLISLANEETSSAENMQTHVPNVKRKRGENNCHQCHTNNKERVAGCTKCKKKYCSLCITKWYTTLNTTDVVEACPGCRNICNCAACLKRKVAYKHLPIPDVERGMEEKIKHSHDIVRVLLPSLKQFVAEENMEREHQARIQGVPITGLHLVKSNLVNNGYICCNYCKGSFLDVYRGCPNCLFKLCVTCCLEIRGGLLRENSQYIVQNDGTIVCPPESLGGCGRGNLELMTMYPTNWVSDLLGKAEVVANVGKSTQSSEAFGVCSGSSQGNETAHLYNYLHCPTALGVARNDLKHFQFHLRRGEPVVIPDVVSAATGLSWDPMVMWRACRKPGNPEHHTKDFRVLNCSSWSEETIGIRQFWNGYAKGLYDGKCQPKILKLEDWPPAESFQEQMPRHFLEFVRCLPFMVYMHPHAGHLNMSARIPMIAQKLDMGPKMSVSYGVGQEQSSSLTMIHYALSDRVDILMHTAAICVGPSTSTEAEGGAIWDIFKRRDVPKLEEYLRKHAGELKHISHLHQLVHPVHEKAFYLTLAHKRKLKEEYGIEPWTFVQKLGDAVFVPAGCPHQIRYLKSCTSVAFNFVAPESIGECIRLSAEYRRLPQNHRYKEDKLQVKQMTLHAVSQAMEYLETITPGASRSRENVPHVHSEVDEMPIPLGSLIYMKQEMKAKLLKLERLDPEHLVQPPHTRAYLEEGIQNLLVQIDEKMQESIVGTSSSS